MPKTRQHAWLAWWTCVTLFLVALTAAFPATLLVLVDSNYSIEQGGLYQWLARAGATSLALAIVWMCWVCPVLRAGSPLVRYAAMNPRKYLHSLQGPVWVPVLVVAMLVAAALYYIKVDGASRHVLRSIRQTGPAPYLAALAMALLIAGVLHARVARRLRRALALRHLCPTCGYDLHATATPACPECGAPRDDLPLAPDATPAPAGS